ncbi:hypothetical protein [Janthinobacterium sp. 1_2014MBL_MicDiv]|uniref:hypothetical protein n=1 Tax=Janthinobacterium sp. 1_2014MBL_MicDiv TaxID=1644131 RepID=UPI0012EC6C36|nr:hypothetical protein [Janthinobacterium sp. 1_2014MBL_MicDiv]
MVAIKPFSTNPHNCHLLQLPPFSARLVLYRHHLYQIINIFLAMIKRDAYIRGLLLFGNGFADVHAASPKFGQQEYFAWFSKGALVNAMTVMSGLTPFFHLSG